MEVAAELARRFGLPFWQFTLSATQANTEAIRVARAVTGRSVVLMFDGKYHGHADELLGALDASTVVPEGLGVPLDATRHVRLVRYNDLEAVERELGRGDVACVLAEAAVTNTGVIRPVDGFHAGLRRLASENGTLLVVDETHTLVAGPGGLTARWGLEPDMLVLGKAISGGIPLGAYGMTAACPLCSSGGPTSRMTSRPVGRSSPTPSRWRPPSHAREVLTTRHEMGGRRPVADGIGRAAHELPWRSHRLYNRSGYTHAPELPRNAVEARARFDLELYNVQRLYMANRGIWEAIDSAGPACGIHTTEADVDRYLETEDGFLREATSA